jgi:AraC family transcriptional regulator, dual regulator of chb operon
MISPKISHFVFKDYISDLSPIAIGDTTFNSLSLFPTHDHDFYEFFLVRKGSFSHTLNGTMSILPEHTLFLIRPADVHTFTNDPVIGPCVCTNVAFPEKFFFAAIHYLQWPSHIVNSFVTLDDPATWVALAARVDRLKRSEIPYRDKAVLFRGLFCEILILLRAAQPENSNTLPPWLENACQEIRKKENFEEGLKRFVELSGRTQEHFTRSFRHHLNLTPTDYLNRVRLNEAAALLISTDTSVIDISMEVGFGNLSHFNARFKALFNMTPREYRKKNRGVFSEV